jgi:hypothetical protein
MRFFDKSGKIRPLAAIGFAAAARHVTCSAVVQPLGSPNSMASTINRSPARPAKDEWGVYDPEQAGLAALYARLDTKTPNPNATAVKPIDRKDTSVKPKQ